MIMLREKQQLQDEVRDLKREIATMRATWDSEFAGARRDYEAQLLTMPRPNLLLVVADPAPREWILVRS